jgi:CheY-like chemotaxis protein
MIDTIMLVDDEDLFHIVFEDACSLLDVSLTLKTAKSADKAEELFKKWFDEGETKHRPECVFVDLNMKGSSFDGIELVRRINFEYGNSVVIGLISSYNEEKRETEAIQAGAQFWMIKSGDIEPKLEEFKKDYSGYKNKTASFKIYR